MISEKHITYTKLVIQFVTSAGVTKIVKDVIDSHVVTESTFDTVKTWAGAAVISSMLVEAASDHTDAKVDKIANWIKKSQEERIANL